MHANTRTMHAHAHAGAAGKPGAQGAAGAQGPAGTAGKPGMEHVYRHALSLTPWPHNATDAHALAHAARTRICAGADGKPGSNGAPGPTGSQGVTIINVVMPIMFYN